MQKNAGGTPSTPVDQKNILNIISRAVTGKNFPDCELSEPSSKSEMAAGENEIGTITCPVIRRLYTAMALIETYT